MFNILKDSRFWIGGAVGFFLGPMVVRTVTNQMSRLKPKA